MAKHLITLPEAVAMLEAVKTPQRHVDAFLKQANAVFEKRAPLTREADEVQVGSGFSHVSRRGHVRFQVGTVEHQLSAQKARQIGLWLLEAAEAAVSDEIVMKLLLDKVGLNVQQLGSVLLDLREIRQGSRETVYEQ